MKKHILSLLCIAVSATLFASNPPKREMRATWIATVTNIDWPSAQSATNQKKELRTILNACEEMNINTVFFQVRTCCDAFYDSAYEPWSSYLKINRGTTPSYDPLAYMIEECHKRGIACHAWMNPYRYSRNGSYWTGSNTCEIDYEHTHPEWLLKYSNNIILDPALPEVRKRITEVVGDVLNKYDVDGIVFDDYFYPYGGTTTQDSASVRKFKPEDMSVGDWRRNNIRMMVQDVYDTIQAVKPYVTFGISPFGIWTTNNIVARDRGLTLPAGISGGNMYEEIYCDPVAWMEDGTVDYISPQLYWKIGGAQDYKKLSAWWAKLANQFGLHFYSSMAVYRYHEQSSSANKGWTIAELQKQAQLNRDASTDNAPGAVLYSTRGWRSDSEFKTAFAEAEFSTPALQPAINWKPAPEQKMVTDLALNGQVLTWENATLDTRYSGQLRYAVYAVEKAKRNVPHIFSEGGSLVGIAYGNTFELPEGISSATHAIGVSVLDRYNNEYSLRILGENVVPAVATNLQFPTPNVGIKAWPVNFYWDRVEQADSYIIQIAKDEAFQEILVAHELTEAKFLSKTRLNLKAAGNGVYYWRVKVRSANADDVWSPVQKFEIGVADGVAGDSYSAVENVLNDVECDVRKVMENGQVVIIREGEKYNVLGTKINN